MHLGARAHLLDFSEMTFAPERWFSKLRIWYTCGIQSLEEYASIQDLAKNHIWMLRGPRSPGLQISHLALEGEAGTDLRN